MRIEETLTGAVIRVQLTNGAAAVLDHLPKQSALAFYRFSQTQEENMRVARYAQQLHTAATGAAHINVNVQR